MPEEKYDSTQLFSNQMSVIPKPRVAERKMGFSEKFLTRTAQKSRSACVYKFGPICIIYMYQADQDYTYIFKYVCVYSSNQFKFHDEAKVLKFFDLPIWKGIFIQNSLVCFQNYIVNDIATISKRYRKFECIISHHADL